MFFVIAINSALNIPNKPIQKFNLIARIKNTATNFLYVTPLAIGTLNTVLNIKRLISSYRCLYLIMDKLNIIRMRNIS